MERKDERNWIGSKVRLELGLGEKCFYYIRNGTGNGDRKVKQPSELSECDPKIFRKSLKFAPYSVVVCGTEISRLQQKE